MTMRDKIAAIIEDVDQDDGGALEMADAILAALPGMIPGMIPELEWVHSPYLQNSNHWEANVYHIWKAADDGMFRLSGDYIDDVILCDTLEAAQAAADAHHRAALCKAMGWT